MHTDKRAWDKKRKELFPVHEIEYNKHDGTLTKVIGYTHDEKDIWNVHGGCFMKYANEARYILMDYTNLDDKNGKRIHEGDVLEFEYDEKQGGGYKRRTIHAKVVNGASFKYKKSGYYVVYKTLRGESAEYPLDWLFVKGSKIVGNIYENPELLEVTK